MMPAREGDCLLVTYGNEQETRRILVDGGRSATWQDVRAHLQAVAQDPNVLELLIITHVDRDHIEGILGLIEDQSVALRFKDIWFNGYHHLLGECLESFGPVQGERLSSALMKPDRPWNRAFESCAVCVKPDGSAVSVQLDGGMVLTILSPDRAKLRALEPEWRKEVTAAGMIPGQPAIQPARPAGYEVMGGRIDVATLADTVFEEDPSKPNGSSIALLAEYDGRRALLTGDAHVGRLVEALRPLAGAEGGRLRLDAMKLSHHGSKHNLSSELIGLLDCRRYLVSTNGSYFGHPDREAIARVIKYGGANVEIAFNYISEQTKAWNIQRLRDQWGYLATYPPGGQGYLAIEL
jgi:hypothetical protein